jgi:DNA polymerase III alpha subunit (gram-positive type)
MADKYRKQVMDFKKMAKSTDFYVFDTETTGLSPTENDVIEFSAVKVHCNSDGNFTITDELDMFINPGYRLPQEITELTGITDEMLELKPSPANAALKIHAFLGDNPILAGYNSVTFDQKFMEAMYEKAALKFTPAYNLDVLVMAREKLPKPHKLISTAQTLGIADGYVFHTSIDDAKCTLGVLEKLLPMYDVAEDVPSMASFKITGVSRWKKSETLDRIYVNNSMRASVYYDVVNGIWNIGSNLPDEAVISMVFKYKGVNSVDELIRIC